MAATLDAARVATTGSTKRFRAARGHVSVLFCILLATTILYSWNLATSGYSDYYSTAAKSMSVSWKAFFFGAFDPQSTITLDKLAGFLIPQALSARIFGFSSWSIALPQVFEGLVTVAAAYYVFSRWSGRFGGVVGALSLATAPLMISMFSHVMEDALLTMCTTLAVAAWQRAIDSERMGWLIGAGILVGLGFQAKMAQAWLVLPALCIGYLWMSRRPRTVKLRDVTWCVITTIVVSLSWMTAMTLIPSAQRPYFDGSIDNNIFSTVLGYNGINRFLSNAVPGALPGDPLFHPVGNAAIVGAVPGPIAHTPFKFFLPQYATQIGWFFPVVAAGLILGVVWLRTNRWPDLQRNLKAGLVMCSLLLITVGGVLSAMSLPHTAYLAAVMLPVAGLTAIGAALLIRAYRQESRWRFALPVAVAVQTAWCLILLRSFPGFAAALAAPVAVLGSLGAAALTLHALRPGRIGRLLAVASILAVLGAALTPTVWTLSTFNPAFAGTADDAYGGPQVAAVAARKLVRHAAYGIGLDSNRSVQPTESVEASAFAYAQRLTSDQWALATDTWRSAAPLILRGQTRLLPIGGYTSRAPSPTEAQFREFVTTGRVRFVLLSPDQARTGVYHPRLDAITGWTMNHCQVVSPSLYLTAPLRAAAAGVTSDTLYDCGP